MRLLALDIAFRNTGYAILNQNLEVLCVGCLTIETHPRVIHIFKDPTFKSHQQDTLTINKTQYSATQLVEILQAYSCVVQKLLSQVCPELAVAEITTLGGMSSKAVTLMTTALTTWVLNLWVKNIELVCYVPQQINRFVKDVLNCAKVSKDLRRKCVKKFIPDVLSLDSKGKQEHVIDAILVGIYHIKQGY